MSTLQISAPLTAAESSAAAPQQTGPVLRFLRAVVEAMAEANRRKAERVVAQVARRRGIRLA